MKLTCPTETQTSYIRCETIFHRLAFGFAFGITWAKCLRYAQHEEVTQISGFALGTGGLLDTNVLAFLTRNACVGGYAQGEVPM